MATFLDVSGLQAFSKLFILILVIVVAYAIISSAEISGVAKWVAIIIAFIIGIFAVLSDLITEILSSILPWVGILLVFTLFVMVAGRNMGASVSDYMDIKWVFLAITIVLFLVGSAYIVRQHISVPGDVDADGNVITEKDYTLTKNFVLHPTVLGVVFTLLVGVITVGLLAGKS